jgi:hypothetical protein
MGKFVLRCQTLSGGPRCQNGASIAIAMPRCRGAQNQSLARNHKTGCIWSGSPSAPPSTCTRAPDRMRKPRVVGISRNIFCKGCDQGLVQHRARPAESAFRAAHWPPFARVTVLFGPFTRSNYRQRHPAVTPAEPMRRAKPTYRSPF